jgi:copper(I)-binding protein
MKKTFLAAALTAVVTLATGVQAQTAPKVEAVWARPTVAGQSAGGGFLKITGGAAADKLLSASAGVSKTVELHTMEMDGNVMRMRQIDAIEVPAGGTVELKPGGRHVMFMGLAQPLKAGTTFPLTLRFEMAAQAPGGAMPAAEHKH